MTCYEKEQKVVVVKLTSFLMEAVDNDLCFNVVSEAGFVTMIMVLAELLMVTSCLGEDMQTATGWCEKTQGRRGEERQEGKKENLGVGELIVNAQLVRMAGVTKISKEAGCSVRVRMAGGASARNTNRNRTPIKELQFVG